MARLYDLFLIREIFLIGPIARSFLASLSRQVQAWWKAQSQPARQPSSVLSMYSFHLSVSRLGTGTSANLPHVLFDDVVQAVDDLFHVDTQEVFVMRGPWKVY